MNQVKPQEPKIFLFGNWITKKDDKVELTADGKLVADWLTAKTSFADPAFESAIRAEFNAQQRYREIVSNKLIILRNQLLNKAEQLVYNITQLISSPEETYRQGQKMGEHAAFIYAAQELANILDNIVASEKQ